MVIGVRLCFDAKILNSIFWFALRVLHLYYSIKSTWFFLLFVSLAQLDIACTNGQDATFPDVPTLLSNWERFETSFSSTTGKKIGGGGEVMVFNGETIKMSETFTYEWSGYNKGSFVCINELTKEFIAPERVLYQLREMVPNTPPDAYKKTFSKVASGFNSDYSFLLDYRAGDERWSIKKIEKEASKGDSQLIGFLGNSPVGINNQILSQLFGDPLCEIKKMSTDGRLIKIEFKSDAPVLEGYITTDPDNYYAIVNAETTVINGDQGDKRHRLISYEYDFSEKPPRFPKSETVTVWSDSNPSKTVFKSTIETKINRWPPPISTFRLPRFGIPEIVEPSSSTTFWLTFFLLLSLGGFFVFRYFNFRQYH